MDDSKHDSDEDRIIRALIKKQRKLADSLDPLERAGTLRVAVELDQRLSRCTDQEIANIMTVAKSDCHFSNPNSQSASTPGEG